MAQAQTSQSLETIQASLLNDGDLPPLSVPATMIGFPPLQAASGGRRA
jgi:hypothetical protein